MPPHRVHLSTNTPCPIRDNNQMQPCPPRNTSIIFSMISFFLEPYRGWLYNEPTLVGLAPTCGRRQPNKNKLCTKNWSIHQDRPETFLTAGAWIHTHEISISEKVCRQGKQINAPAPPPPTISHDLVVCIESLVTTRGRAPGRPPPPTPPPAPFRSACPPRQQRRQRRPRQQPPRPRRLERRHHRWRGSWSKS